ncbi:hypothetical protein [Aliiroseovarius sp.]|uniref:hypothetical protein n=1 Tax=Aliiroseovarius sp. TaxID=1872442 RepID=UPI003BABCE1F
MTQIRTRAWRRAQMQRAQARKSKQSDLPHRFFIKHRNDLWRRRDRMFHDARTGAFGVDRQRDELLAWDEGGEEDQT